MLVDGIELLPGNCPAIKKTGKLAYTEEMLDLAMGPGREIGN